MDQREVSTFKPRTVRNKGTPNGQDNKGSLAFIPWHRATGKSGVGYTLLWAITASNKAVVFENAVTFSSLSSSPSSPEARQ